MLNVSAKVNVEVKADIPVIASAGPPIVGYHFLVTFFGIGPVPLIPNPIDIRFQSVSGIGVEFPLNGNGPAGTTARNLPNPPSFSSLVLTRGYILGSVYRKELEVLLLNDKLKFYPKQLQVMLFNADSAPVASWLFLDVVCTNWNINGIDANSDDFLIETMTFSYNKYIPITL